MMPNTTGETLQPLLLPSRFPQNFERASIVAAMLDRLQARMRS
jgi:hypothetical protein